MKADFSFGELQSVGCPSGHCSEFNCNKRWQDFMVLTSENERGQRHLEGQGGGVESLQERTGYYVSRDGWSSRSDTEWMVASDARDNN